MPRRSKELGHRSKVKRRPKAAAAKEVAVSTQPSEPVQSPPPPAVEKGKLTQEERFRRIQEAAYYLAEKDGFRQDPAVYWLTAEAEFLKKEQQ